MVSEKTVLIILMGLQYERPWLKDQSSTSTLTFNLFIAIVSLGLIYQVKIMTLASTVFKKSTFQKISDLNALGSISDLDVK